MRCSAPMESFPARLANPLSEEASLLRSNGSVSMAGAIEWNLNHGQRNVRLFEIGRHYRFASAGNPGGSAITSIETLFLTLARAAKLARKDFTILPAIFVRRPERRSGRSRRA